jgi:hypothetical protein
VDIAPEYGSLQKFLHDHAFPLHAHEEENEANEGAWSCHVRLYDLLLHTLSYQASHCHNIYHSIAHAKHLTTTVQTKPQPLKHSITPDATTNYQLQPVFLQCTFSYSQHTRQAARRTTTTRTDGQQTDTRSGKPYRSGSQLERPLSNTTLSTLNSPDSGATNRAPAAPYTELATHHRLTATPRPTH